MNDVEKAKKLIDNIRQEFPKGCTNMRCDDCPFINAYEDTIEQHLCSILINMN